MAGVTIYDVAKEANCSTATVSLVLKKSNRIKEDTRNRVMQAIEKLHYTPNYMAQSLSVKSTQTLGLIVPNVENPLYSLMISGVERQAAAMGYNIILGMTDSISEKEDLYITMLQSKRVDGLILFPSFLEILAERLSHIDASRTPFILCGSSGKGRVDVPYVKCDNRMGAYIAVNHLIDIGCKRIACIFPVVDKNQYQSRLSGYQEALYYRGIKYNENLIAVCSPDSDEIFETTAKFVQEQKPDGIFCLYDYAAIPVMNAITSLGLRIPDEVALIGYDNIRISKHMPIALSTIDTHGYEVGVKSAEWLINQINGVENPENEIIIKPDLVTRKSTMISGK